MKHLVHNIVIPEFDKNTKETIIETYNKLLEHHQVEQFNLLKQIAGGIF